MQDHYSLLLTIYGIVKDDPQPDHYPCRPRELILRRLQEWSHIQQQIQLLEEEQLLVTEQQDTLIIRLTSAGLAKAREQAGVASEQ
jgi:hypothetical protein